MSLHKAPQAPEQLPASTREGKAGYILLWLLGVPVPVLLIIFLLRGCN